MTWVGRVLRCPRCQKVEHVGWWGFGPDESFSLVEDRDYDETEAQCPSCGHIVLKADITEW